MKRILVIGATGQIGSELTPALRKKYGESNVVATGYNKEPERELLNAGPFKYLDCRDIHKIADVVKQYDINMIYHLAALLSATAEENPQLAWDVNVNGLYNVLEVSREFNCSVFTPSSIGAFGHDTPRNNTPQDTVQHPDTMYGVTKVTGEILCNYYYSRFGVDTRGVRYPGIISSKTLPLVSKTLALKSANPPELIDALLSQ